VSAPDTPGSEADAVSVGAVELVVATPDAQVDRQGAIESESGVEGTVVYVTLRYGCFPALLAESEKKKSALFESSLTCLNTSPRLGFAGFSQYCTTGPIPTKPFHPSVDPLQLCSLYGVAPGEPPVQLPLAPAEFQLAVASHDFPGR
jgi:hypothetical protein